MRWEDVVAGAALMMRKRLGYGSGPMADSASLSFAAFNRNYSIAHAIALATQCIADPLVAFVLSHFWTAPQRSIASYIDTLTDDVATPPPPFANRAIAFVDDKRDDAYRVMVGSKTLSSLDCTDALRNVLSIVRAAEDTARKNGIAPALSAFAIAMEYLKDGGPVDNSAPSWDAAADAIETSSSALPAPESSSSSSASASASPAPESSPSQAPVGYDTHSLGGPRLLVLDDDMGGDEW